MKKILVILLSGSLIFSLAITPAEAGWKTKSMIGVGAVILTSGAILSNAQLSQKSNFSKYNYLIKHPNQANDFFNEYPQDKNTILDMLQDKIQQLTRLGNEFELDKANKLFESITGTTYIPPYNQTAENKPIIHDNPIQHQNPADSILDNPIETYQHDNVIYTPQGEPINTIIDFPNQPIATWEDYLYAKKQSDILADNMEANGKGKRQPGYAAHHIVAWDDNRYVVCQELRDLLNNNSIDVNDFENGVYLPTRKATKNSNEAYHPEIHTEKYYKNVYERLRRFDGDTQSMRDELKKIGNELKSNQFKY